jgi:hypothetical protein
MMSKLDCAAADPLFEANRAFERVVRQVQMFVKTAAMIVTVPSRRPGRGIAASARDAGRRRECDD